jgi:signal transduction histidine kinase
MELDPTDFDLPTTVDNALMLVRERAGRRSITLRTSVDERLGQVRADERKIRQVVLNLLSNAIKFTPEGGRMEVAAVPKDGGPDPELMLKQRRSSCHGSSRKRMTSISSPGEITVSGGTTARPSAATMDLRIAEPCSPVRRAPRPQAVGSRLTRK